jgi:hypothetical protein
MSANAYYRELQALGLGARRGDVLALFKAAKSITTASPEEPFRPIELAPSPQEITPYPSRKATGIRQNVTIIYRDRTTGGIKQTYWSTVGSSPLTREEAIATAIDAYSEHAERYGQDLIGAVHTSAYQLVPDILGGQ